MAFEAQLRISFRIPPQQKGHHAFFFFLLLCVISDFIKVTKPSQVEEEQEKARKREREGCSIARESREACRRSSA